MSTNPISKSILLSHRQCPKRAWLEANGYPEGERSLGQLAVIENGQDVHAAGRRAHQGAVMVPKHLTLEVAAEETKRLMESGSGALLEAAMVADGLGVRIDVLLQGEAGWRIREVKSGGDVKDEYLDDCAIQYHCAQQAGIAIDGVEVMHPNTDIERKAGGDGSEVLVVDNVTDTVHWRSMQVPIWLADCRSTLAGGMPAVKIGEQCSEPHDCPFTNVCGKVKKEADPDCIGYLPNKAGVINELRDSGTQRITDVPAWAIETERNRLVWESVCGKKTVIRKWLAQQVAALGYPRRCIDFEAAGFAIPRFDGMRPYQQIPFQISCHTKESASAEWAHSEFLDVTGQDPRRAFSEWLLNVAGDEGPILVYSSYEATKIKELAKAFPDLSDALMKLVGRLFDLLPLARKGYYAPAMCGSWSIKAIAPTLPVDAAVKGYDEIGEVADGMAAQGAYATLTNPKVIGPQKEALRVKTLDYCRTDTWNLVRFMEFLESEA